MRQSRYRFENKPRLVPVNETPEERLLRMLDTPERTIKDPKKFLAALRKTVAASK